MKNDWESRFQVWKAAKHHKKDSPKSTKVENKPLAINQEIKPESSNKSEHKHPLKPRIPEFIKNREEHLYNQFRVSERVTKIKAALIVIVIILILALLIGFIIPQVYQSKITLTIVCVAIAIVILVFIVYSKR